MIKAKRKLDAPQKLALLRKQRGSGIFWTVIEAVILLIIHYETVEAIPFLYSWLETAHVFFRDLIFGLSGDRTPWQVFFCEALEVCRETPALTTACWLVMVPAPLSVITSIIEIAFIKMKESRKSTSAESDAPSDAKAKKSAAKKAPAPTKLVLIKAQKSARMEKIAKACRASVYKDTVPYLRVQMLAAGDDSRNKDVLHTWENGCINLCDSLEGESFSIKIAMNDKGVPYIDGEVAIPLERGIPVVICRNTRDINISSNDIPRYAITWIGGIER